MGPLANAQTKPTGVAVFLVLGAGFLALFAGVEWFPAVWVFGFAVLVPLVALIANDDSERDPDDERAPDDPVEQLKRQYAAGELTDDEFERRLELELAEDDTTKLDRERELE